MSKLELVEIETLPIVTISISSLLLDNSSRQGGDNKEHIRVLAESEDRLPPIVVHGQSLQVIDGIHRVRAAVMRVAENIKAKIHHGTDDEAFVFAVRLNVAYGLPLTRADRTAAALRIIGSHPQWSDRMIARAVGLAAGTIVKLRRRSTAQNVQSKVRVGKDGRARPVNSAAGRLKAAELLVEQPTSSIRAIAKEARGSPSTVHDVQQRLRAGHQPVSEHHRDLELRATPGLPHISPGRGVLDHPGSSTGIDVAAILVDPYHCAHPAAKLVREYARVWTEIATRLEQRWCRGAAGAER